MLDGLAAKPEVCVSLVEKPILPQCRVSVAVPVKDEAENLPATLQALVNQVDLRGKQLNPRSFEIIILANNCTDNTAKIARCFSEQNNQPPVHVVETSFSADQAHVGHARCTVMDEAFLRLASGAKKRGVIATTDGDTRVAPDWIAATLCEINLGADAVSGRIVVDRDELATLDAPTRRFHLQDVGYRLLAAELEGFLDPQSCDPHPRHHQHFGASFAVTTAAYKRAGGLPVRRYLEDVAFYQALLRLDARFRHSPLVRVKTSARRTGRTEVGLSWQLREWTKLAAQHQSYLVESAEELESKFRASAGLRKLCKQARAGKRVEFNKIMSLAEVLGLNEHWLCEQILTRQTFGQMHEKVWQKQAEIGEWQKLWAKVEIEKAIGDLRQKLSLLRTEKTKIFRKRPADKFLRAAPSLTEAHQQSIF
jgi:hypothetical protein